MILLFNYIWKVPEESVKVSAKFVEGDEWDRFLWKTATK